MVVCGVGCIFPLDRFQCFKPLRKGFPLYFSSVSWSCRMPLACDHRRAFHPDLGFALRFAESFLIFYPRSAWRSAMETSVFFFPSGSAGFRQSRLFFLDLCEAIALFFSLSFFRSSLMVSFPPLFFSPYCAQLFFRSNESSSCVSSS